MAPKYPEIEVRLVEVVGGDFALFGAISGMMRRAGLGQSEISAFIAEATAGDHDFLFRTCAAWVTLR